TTSQPISPNEPSVILTPEAMVGRDPDGPVEPLDMHINDLCRGVPESARHDAAAAWLERRTGTDGQDLGVAVDAAFRHRQIDPPTDTGLLFLQPPQRAKENDLRRTAVALGGSKDHLAPRCRVGLIAQRLVVISRRIVRPHAVTDDDVLDVLRPRPLPDSAAA